MSGARVFACSCNGTVDVESAKLGEAVARHACSVEAPARELCRREVGRFVRAVEGDAPLLVTCTQESALFEEIAASRNAVAPVRFVNVRERAGWGAEGARAGAKIAALVAMAAAARVEPVPAVEYRSRGRVLVIGPARDAIEWGERLCGTLTVTVLATTRDGTALPARRDFAVVSGRVASLTGWLGEFDARWEVENPIDLDACVRCGACLAACPEQAIGDDFQVDAERCRGHRRCVAACRDVGAIDFARAERARGERFDLVLDLGAVPAIGRHDPPPGYLCAGRDEGARARAALELAGLVGEFEKPRYFTYDEAICARGRNGVEACRACHDACGASAITLERERIRVEPHLCVGCASCALVCPSGAIAHQVPPVSELVRRIRIGLQAYRARGGRDAVVLLHDGEKGAAMLDEAGRGPLSAPGPARAAPGVRGLPARVIPVEVHRIGAAGTDLALAALAVGASQVVAMCTPADADEERAALEAQYGHAQRIVSALAPGAARLRVLAVRDAAELEEGLHALERLAAIGEPATFDGAPRKRGTIERSIGHLHAQAVASGLHVADFVELATGAPFGSLKIDTDACTLCSACVGACPEHALQDSPDVPALRFVERSCVQCGLCVRTCPENAVGLVPRYAFGGEAKAVRVLIEAKPFACVRCGKPFGNDAMVRAMTRKLAQHPMFSDRAARRLLMCADCRVVDLLESGEEVGIDAFAPGGPA